MARSFSSKDAKKLIKRHKVLLSKLQEIAEFSEKSRIEINSFSRKLAIDNIFQNNVRNELLSGLSDKSANICQLLRLIWFYNETLPFASQSRLFLYEYADRISRLIRDLSVGSVWLFWLFSSLKRKTRAKNAFEQLKLILKDQKYHNSVLIIQKVENLQAVSDEDIWIYYSEKKNYLKRHFYNMLLIQLI